MLPVLVCLGWTMACGPKQKQTETVAAGGEQVCFLNVTGKDSLVVRLNIDDHHVVTGVINWLPFEKDKMTGTLDGTLQDSIITAMYTYSAEGITEKEARTLKITADSIAIKVGDPDRDDWMSAPKVNCP